VHDVILDATSADGDMTNTYVSAAYVMTSC